MYNPLEPISSPAAMAAAQAAVRNYNNELQQRAPRCEVHGDEERCERPQPLPQPAEGR